jgi:molybdopterin converting factor small subunit
VNVLIPSALQSYTKANYVEASGESLSALLADLERQFPGIRFRIIDEQDRIRPHMRFFINGEQIFDLQHQLHKDDDVCLVQALSGG